MSFSPSDSTLTNSSLRYSDKSDC